VTGISLPLPFTIREEGGEEISGTIDYKEDIKMEELIV
jgi:hypothetical protein